MPPTGRPPTFSVLVETENLASVDRHALDLCLASLAAQSLSPQRAEEVLLLDSGTAPAELLAHIRSRYPWVEVASVGKASDYFDAKMRGAELASGEVVVLCDSDCVYEPEWLEALMSAFSPGAGVEVVTGENTTPLDGPYGLAMALTYLFERYSGESRLASAAAYDTNNVAFRREFLLRNPLPSGLPMYRGHHVLHARALRRRGHTIWRQPGARAVHPVPETRSYFFWRFLLLGDEALTIARLSRDGANRSAASIRWGRDGLLCLAILGGKVKRMLHIGHVVFSREPGRATALPLAAPIAGAAMALYAAGLAASYGRPGWMLAAHHRAQERHP